MRRSTLVVAGIIVGLIAEVALLTVVGRSIGVGWLLTILVAEAAIGGWLVRREGSRAWASLRAAERDPAAMGPALTDAALVLMGAILLMLPGFLSDAVGLLFLIPATRGIARRGVTGVFRALTRKYRDQAGLIVAKTTPSTVVEGETVPEAPRAGGGVHDTRKPSDPTIVAGEIEP